MLKSSAQYPSSLRRARAAGFSLLELIVALTVFLVISGAALSLVSRHMPLFASQQNQAMVNFGLRNAAAQLQLDGANAGSGFYPGALGMVIVPGSTSDESCHDPDTNVYSEKCFDQLNVIMADPRSRGIYGKDNGSDANGCKSGVARDSELTILPIAPMTADQLKDYYKAGDQILVISSAQDDSQGSVPGTIATATLSKDAQVTGTDRVKLSHNPTAGEDGVNSPEDDKYGISTTFNNKLGTRFCAGQAWVVKLTPATYKVDTSDASNPKLVRSQSSDAVCKPGLAKYPPECVIAEQIIGFKIGAQIYDPATSAITEDCKPYCYNPASYKYDWSQIRAIRVSLIGRTKANSELTGNKFDGGRYKIEAISVIVSPRNLTLQDEK